MIGITQIILKLRSQAGFSPRDINCGGCEDFAYDVVNRMGRKRAEAIWGGDVPPEMWSEKVQNLPGWFYDSADTHCFVVFENRFYDSECPFGCDFPDKLPHFQREILTHLEMVG